MVETIPAVNTFPPEISDAVEGAATAFFRGACGLTHVPDGEIDDALTSAGIMSTISFVGDYQWAFALAFPEEVAVSLARTFAGFDIPFDSPDMGDVVGEMVNVIAGDIAGRLAKQKIEAKMSLPTTVHGSNVSMLIPGDVSTKRCVFTGPSGTCWFDLVSTPKPSLVPEPREAGGPTAAPEPAPASQAAPTLSAPAAPDPAQDAWAAALAEAERQMAEQDALEAAQRASGVSPASAPVQVQAAPGRLTKLLPFILIFGCGGWGALAGVLATKKPAPTAEHAEKEADKAHGPKDPVTEIDALIRKDKFEEALKKCIAASMEKPAPRETVLALREALCLEGSGRWGESLEAYRRAEEDPDAAVSIVAVLGQARCAAQDGSYVLARALANRVLLRSGNPNCRGARVREEVEHLRARIALQEGGAKPLPRDATARPMLSTSATNGLDWLPATPVAPATGDVFEVHRILGAPGALKVTTGLSHRPMREVLNALAATAGWKVTASADTLTKLKWAVGPVEVDHMPLPEFLNVLLTGTGVSWSVQKDELVLTSAGK